MFDTSRDGNEPDHDGNEPDRDRNEPDRDRNEPDRDGYRLDREQAGTATTDTHGGRWCLYRGEGAFPSTQ